MSLTFEEFTKRHPNSQRLIAGKALKKRNLHVREKFPIYQKDLERVYQEKKEEFRKKNIQANYLYSNTIYEPNSQEKIRELRNELKRDEEFIKFMEKERRSFAKPPPKLKIHG